MNDELPTSEEERIISSSLLKREDEQQETGVRPSKLEDYVGQYNVKKNIKVMIDAAKLRGDSVDHVLFYGPPGLGKTTLSQIISNELGVNIRITSGPAIERSGDLASLLTNLEDGDVLFIDEIHRLNKVVQEMLYPAMEEYAIDMIIGKGPSAQTVRLELPKFTLVGATTQIGMITGPMRDRFGAILRLEYYDEASLSTIIDRASSIIGIDMQKDASLELAKRSRGTPRIANRLLRRVRDVADLENHTRISPSTIIQTCELLGIDHKGFDNIDRDYLIAIHTDFNGGPVGIDTIAAALSEDIRTLEEVIEPYLIQHGFIQKTPRGRIITDKAINHIEL